MVAAQVEFPLSGARKIRAVFDAEPISSDGGALLLRQVDRRLGLLDSLAATLPDPRDRRYIEHPLVELLRQRVYGIALGYVFVCARALDEIGARVWRIAVIWSTVGIVLGEIAIACGLVHTYVPTPEVHGIAGLSTLPHPALRYAAWAALLLQAGFFGYALTRFLLGVQSLAGAFRGPRLRDGGLRGDILYWLVVLLTGALLYAAARWNPMDVSSVRTVAARASRWVDPCRPLPGQVEALSRDARREIAAARDAATASARLCSTLCLATTCSVTSLETAITPIGRPSGPRSGW